MAADMALSMIGGLNGVISTADRVESSSVTLPAALTSAATELKALLSFEFAGDLYMSLTNTNGFTKRGIKLQCDAKARTISGIAFDFTATVDITACLPGDPASCKSAAATALAATPTNETSAEVALLSAGVLSPILFARRIKNAITDPLVKFSATASLPAGIGDMSFSGELSKNKFLLSAEKNLNLFGMVTSKWVFSIGLEAGAFKIGLASNDYIFGFQAAATGIVQSDKTPYLSASLALSVGDPFSLVQTAPVDCKPCAAKAYAQCDTGSGCVWDRTNTVVAQCKDVTTSHSVCQSGYYPGCAWSGSYWYGACAGTTTSSSPVCNHWKCTSAGSAAISAVDNGKFTASVAASFAFGAAATVSTHTIHHTPYTTCTIHQQEHAP